MDTTATATKTDYTMSFGRANLIALLLMILLGIVFIVPFALMWDYETYTSGKKTVMEHFFSVIIGGIIIHEFLHGLTWACFAKKRLKAIKFGFKWKYLTPYCHCKEALKVKHYRIGGAMPLVVMGILPLLAGFVTGNGFLFCFGLLFTFAATGDLSILFMMRKLDKECYVSDHPDKVGFNVVN